jgi:hypothetical protein
MNKGNGEHRVQVTEERKVKYHHPSKTIKKIKEKELKPAQLNGK